MSDATDSMVARPVLVVVSGHAGAGKTTLAHRLAAAIGCPAVCRDEIKEGMAAALAAERPSAFAGSAGDALTMRTLPVFFSVIEMLLRGGVTTVAEAAFQHHVWQPRLQPLTGLADLRVLHCSASAEVAFSRVRQRSSNNPLRQVHADHWPDAGTFARHSAAFRQLALSVPALEVDTTDGYRPDLASIARFALSPAEVTGPVDVPAPPDGTAWRRDCAARPAGP